MIAKAYEENQNGSGHSRINCSSELALLTNAHVYLVINRNARYQVYKSTDTPRRPPTAKEIVSYAEGLTDAQLLTIILRKSATLSRK